MKNSKSIILLGLFVSVIYILVLHYENALKKSNRKFDYATQEAIIYKNKYNESVIQSKALEGGKNDLKEEVERWKLKGDTLRTKINKLTKQVSYLKQEASINITAGTSVKPGDTVVIDSISYVYPVYVMDTVNKWIDLKAVAKKDSFNIDLKIKNINTEFDVSYHPKKFLGITVGKGAVKVTAISRNPYVENKELKSVIISDKKRYLLPKIIITALGTILLVKTL